MIRAYKHIINCYSKYTVKQLNDKIYEAQASIAQADSAFMQSGLETDKAAMQRASKRLYNLHIALRNRGEEK